MIFQLVVQLLQGLGESLFFFFVVVSLVLARCGVLKLFRAPKTIYLSGAPYFFDPHTLFF